MFERSLIGHACVTVLDAVLHCDEELACSVALGLQLLRLIQERLSRAACSAVSLQQC